jgi:hypothetical protein
MKYIVKSTGLFLISTLLILAGCDSSTDDADMAIEIDSDDIAGVVTSASGPEAGVWVIAETDNLDTRYIKTVVTDDDGNYLLPDLPSANYSIWVRGYGLVDSAKVEASPGVHLDLTAIVAPDAASAAEVYPAAYWSAMIEVPTDEEVAHLDYGLDEYLAWVKNLGCTSCHQLGNLYTRTLPETLGEFETSHAAWIRRTQAGQAAFIMIRQAAAQLRGVPYKYLSEWTDRVAAGAIPHVQPERPTGLERNVVVTVRDWSKPTGYMHDLSGTDRRDPTVNAYGPLYGAPEHSTDDFPVLDPVSNSSSAFFAPVRDEDTPGALDYYPMMAPSPHWGPDQIWDSKANAHNPMLDQDGRVWYTATVRNSANNPDFCLEGSDHPSAQAFPITTNVARHLSYYEPDTGEYVFVDTCFATHHLQFAEDESNTLWTSGSGDIVGWLDTNMLLETGDAAASQGWTAMVLDYNGNGQRDEYIEPGEPANADMDMRIPGAGQIANYGFYAVMPSPVDNSVWGSNTGVPGSITRLDPGENPPATALVERYNVPAPGFGVRGADIDRNGVVWVSLGSGHMGEFDRSKCTGPLNGPDATGDHCPEGWTFHDLPGPGFVNYPDFSVEASYYTWVDQHDTSGLGANTPIATGNQFDGLHALVDGEFVTMRVPYPMGFFTKGFEGRIDDPNAGWKGRGLWVPSGDRTPWHKEDGDGSLPLVVQFQVRPDPLAK